MVEVLGLYRLEGKYESEDFDNFRSGVRKGYRGIVRRHVSRIIMLAMENEMENEIETGVMK